MHGTKPSLDISSTSCPEAPRSPRLLPLRAPAPALASAPGRSDPIRRQGLVAAQKPPRKPEARERAGSRVPWVWGGRWARSTQNGFSSWAPSPPPDPKQKAPENTQPKKTKHASPTRAFPTRFGLEPGGLGFEAWYTDQSKPPSFKKLSQLPTNWRFGLVWYGRFPHLYKKSSISNPQATNLRLSQGHLLQEEAMGRLLHLGVRSLRYAQSGCGTFRPHPQNKKTKHLRRAARRPLG